MKLPQLDSGIVSLIIGLGSLQFYRSQGAGALLAPMNSKGWWKGTMVGVLPPN